jgi:flagellin
MLQTFDGASKEISTLLNRMRDLTVQASNGTYTANDIASLGEEYTALRTEIGRIIDATEWNGMAKMDQGGTISLQIGANSGAAETMALSIMDWDRGTSTDLTVTETTQGAGNTAEVQTVTLSAMNSGDTLTLLYTDPNGVRQSYMYTAPADYSTAAAAETAIIAAGTTGLPGFTIAGGGNGTLTLTYNTAGVDVNLAIAKVNSGAVPNDWDSRTLDELDARINNVTAERAKYGAYISRLESASDNLLSVAQNTDASRGQIEDADYAAETTELARTQIIAQAGTAMLAQANQIKQSVLALLK